MIKQGIDKKEMWDDFYDGKETPIQEKVAVVATQREVTFNRFEPVLRHIEGHTIIDIGSGHATLCKMIRKEFPSPLVLATDQSSSAKLASGYSPYAVCGYKELPQELHSFDLAIATQVLDYIVDLDDFLQTASILANKILLTVSNGELKHWGQINIFDENNFRQLLEKHGTIEVFEVYPQMLLAKLKFND